MTIKIANSETVSGIDIECPHCGQTFIVDDSNALDIGKQLASIAESALERHKKQIEDDFSQRMRNLQEIEIPRHRKDAADRARLEAEHLLLGERSGFLGEIAELKRQLSQSEEENRRGQIQMEELRATAKIRAKAGEVIGEAFEKRFEKELREAFPDDEVIAVERGRPGADLLQKIKRVSSGNVLGRISIELKDTMRWPSGAVEKLRRDRDVDGSDVGVLVSRTLPKGVHSICTENEIYIVSIHAAIETIKLLRKTLLDLSVARLSALITDREVQELQVYLGSAAFREHVVRIVESHQESKDVRAKAAKQFAESQKEMARLDDIKFESFKNIISRFRCIGSQALAQIPDLTEIENES